METAADRLMQAIEDQKKIDGLNRKQKLVYEVIMANPGVQNDDVALLEAVWTREGWQEGKSLYWNLSRVTRSETITRRRRDLHQMGLIEYSKEADNERMEAFENERDQHSQGESWSWLND